MPQLRIFSYLPNPRIAKATIAARLCGVEIEVRGASGGDLVNWLWDFDARPISAQEKEGLSHHVVQSKVGFTTPLYKTPAFLAAHPFGTVPAAFGPDGKIGIFESNSILRAVARIASEAHGLYGADPYVASRIDSFLDLGHDFGRDVQAYVLGLRDDRFSRELYETSRKNTSAYLGGIERALGDGPFIVGNELTLADIAFACELALLHNEANFVSKLTALDLEPLLVGLRSAHPKSFGHFETLLRHPAFAPDLKSYLEALPIRKT